MHSTLHVALRLVLVSSLTAYILLRLLSVIDWTILRFFLATLFTTLVNAFGPSLLLDVCSALSTVFRVCSAKFSFLRLPPVRNWKKQTQELTIIEISLENRRAGHRNLGRGEDADLGKAEHAAKYLSYGPKHKKLLLKRARHVQAKRPRGRTSLPHLIRSRLRVRGAQKPSAMILVNHRMSSRHYRTATQAWKKSTPFQVRRRAIRMRTRSRIRGTP